MKRARFSFLELGKDGPGKKQGDTPGKPEPVPVRNLNRVLEPDDELPLDRTGSEVICHTCMACGAENFPQSRVCRVCEGSLGGPGQAEYDLDMHRKKMEAAKELAEQLEKQKMEARESTERMLKETQEADTRERLSSAKTRLWFWGALSVISTAMVALLYVYASPPQFLGLIVIGIVFYVTYRMNRGSGQRGSGRWFPWNTRPR